MALPLDSLSDTERNFTRKVVLEAGVREDGREHREARELNVELLGEYGSCIVSLGPTKVLAQCSAHLCEPKATRPNEGRLSIYFDVSPMAAFFQDSRTMKYRVGIDRLLDRVVRDSDCVDLENLCLVAAEVAWEIRVDVVLLNLGGNVAECASIATIAALAYFRRPDVTIVGREVTVHSVMDREPVPLHIYHYPFCLGFAFFDPLQDARPTKESQADTEDDLQEKPSQTPAILVDPTLTEEFCSDGILTVGVNSHEEVCALHQRGCLLTAEQIELCTKLACARAAKITETIKHTLNLEADAAQKPNGSTESSKNGLKTTTNCTAKYGGDCAS